MEVHARTVILALGQEREVDLWTEGLGLGSLVPGPDSRLGPKLYAAGDLVTGPSTVVGSMASGVACAKAILQGAVP